MSAAGSLVWKLARACALAVTQRDDAVSLTAAFRGALTTSEGKEMPVDQLADTIPGMSVYECALMDRIATGDPGALEALYHRFHPKLARFLWRLIGRRDGLEEIINDTFVEVWKGARNFREASLVVSAWMFGIAYRKALEKPEQAKDALDDAELSDPLSQGLRAVPFEQRLALLLTYQMGCGLEEITGVSAATVNARVLGARAKLRHRLPAPGS